MLILSRYNGEKIVLDFTGMKPEDLAELCRKTIDIEVVEIRGEKVRIGTTAPKFVAVHRLEVWQEIQREKVKHPPEVPPVMRSMSRGWKQRARRQSMEIWHERRHLQPHHLWPAARGPAVRSAGAGEPGDRRRARTTRGAAPMR